MSVRQLECMSTGQYATLEQVPVYQYIQHIPAFLGAYDLLRRLDSPKTAKELLICLCAKLDGEPVCALVLFCAR
jgi:hypothetical protein